jgi:hypothetical protein
LLARDIGQVRELISLAKPEEPIETYPTVRQAVERLEAEGR